MDELTFSSIQKRRLINASQRWLHKLKAFCIYHLSLFNRQSSIVNRQSSIQIADFDVEDAGCVLILLDPGFEPPGPDRKAKPGK